MSRPRLLVLGSCAGIGSDGFEAAGWDTFGVDLDHRPQKYDPHPHATGDMLEVLRTGVVAPGVLVGDFDAISAHPPCQGESALSCLRDAQGKKAGRPLVDFALLRVLLEATGLPWVMENVPRSPLRAPATTCGSAFGLAVRRHRWWESSRHFVLPSTGCRHREQGRPWGVYGSLSDDIPAGGRTVRNHHHGMLAMGVTRGTPWSYLCEAIPPAFSAFIGAAMRDQLDGGHVVGAAQLELFA